jgi:hypothetical protein
MRVAAAVLALCSTVAFANPDYHKVAVRNDCDRPIRVAINWQPSTDSPYWRTDWFQVNPKKSIFTIETPADKFYIYAETLGVPRLIWHGACTDSTYLPEVIFDKDNQIYDCTRPVDIEKYTFFTQRFNCY